MQQIPVDASRVRVLVVGEPTPQFKDGQARLDRDSGRPLWSVDVTMIAEGRAETERLSLPEGGFQRPSDRDLPQPGGPRGYPVAERQGR